MRVRQDHEQLDLPSVSGIAIGVFENPAATAEGPSTLYN